MTLKGPFQRKLFYDSIILNLFEFHLRTEVSTLRDFTKQEDNGSLKLFNQSDCRED